MRLLQLGVRLQTLGRVRQSSPARNAECCARLPRFHSSCIVHDLRHAMAPSAALIHFISCGSICNVTPKCGRSAAIVACMLRACICQQSGHGMLLSASCYRHFVTLVPYMPFAVTILLLLFLLLLLPLLLLTTTTTTPTVLKAIKP